jgi:hypothetical protein
MKNNKLDIKLINRKLDIKRLESYITEFNNQNLKQVVEAAVMFGETEVLKALLNQGKSEILKIYVYDFTTNHILVNTLFSNKKHSIATCKWLEENLNIKLDSKTKLLNGSLPKVALSQGEVIIKIQKAFLAKETPQKQQFLNEAKKQCQNMINSLKDNNQINWFLENLTNLHYIINFDDTKLEKYIVDQNTKLKAWKNLGEFYINLSKESYQELKLAEAVDYIEKAYTLIQHKCITDKSLITEIAGIFGDRLASFHPSMALKLYEYALKQDINNEVLKKIIEDLKLNMSSGNKLHEITVDNVSGEGRGLDIGSNLVLQIDKLQDSNEISQFIEKTLKESPLVKDINYFPLQYYFFLHYSLNKNTDGIKVALGKMANILSSIPLKYQSEDSHHTTFFINALRIYVMNEAGKGNFNTTKAILKLIKNIKLPEALIEEIKLVINLVEQNNKINSPIENKIENIDLDKKNTEETSDKASTHKKTKELEKTQSIVSINNAIKVNNENPNQEIELPKSTQKIKVPEKNFVKSDILEYQMVEMLIASGDTDKIDSESWHRYFKTKKKIEIQRGFKTASNKENSDFWKIGNIVYKLKDAKTENEFQVTQIMNFKTHKLFKHNDYYAVIEPNLLKEVGIYGVQFKNALPNNIKIIKNDVKHCIIELCINEDIRLVTHNIIKLPDNKSLIIFEKQMNHEQVKNNLKPLNFIDLEKVEFNSEKVEEKVNNNNFNEQIHYNFDPSSSEEHQVNISAKESNLFDGEIN